MAFMGIGFLVGWLVISLLGFARFRDPRHQVLFSGSLITVAVVTTFGVLRNAGLGVFLFGIGVTAALVRFTRAWRRLPAARLK
ncbi:hypothetical protein [Streptomyces sp. NPDC051662]|uniref:hypothetical protein n=1 Tax=Streptomyces sp. NPDC051662 TaxID=3154750 RepID=UPI00342DA89D